MDYDALEKRLREPPFGTETSERNLMMAAADAIADLRARNEALMEANGVLEDALQEAGDDYPGSSCQQWCQQQVKRAREIVSANREG
jgi:hypothetical protein